MEHLRSHYNIALLFCLKVLENAELLKAWKALQVSIENTKLQYTVTCYNNEGIGN